MRRLTVDASVACKWFLAGAHDEPNQREAHAMLDELLVGRVAFVSPAHWRAEVLAVLVRRRPEHAVEVARSLTRLQVTIRDDPKVDEIALRLARETGAHLFDTLYHAVALATPDGMLVTADSRYLAAASRFGQVIALKDYVSGVEEPRLDYRVIAQRALRRVAA